MHEINSLKLDIVRLSKSLQEAEGRFATATAVDVDRGPNCRVNMVNILSRTVCLAEGATINSLSGESNPISTSKLSECAEAAAGVVILVDEISY